MVMISKQIPTAGEVYRNLTPEARSSLAVTIDLNGGIVFSLQKGFDQSQNRALVRIFGESLELIAGEVLSHWSGENQPQEGENA